MEDKKDKKKDVKDMPAERGKKAIDAEKKSLGEDPSSQATKDKEEKDAEQWRNEG